MMVLGSRTDRRALVPTLDTTLWPEDNQNTITEQRFDQRNTKMSPQREDRMSRLLVADAIAAAIIALPLALTGAAQAQDTYKIGASVGLTGYAAANDRFWRDGLNVAADAINAKGGILGKKIEIIAEDNRSEPQEAVVGYRKMISSDNVKIFASGCVSAGNFAAAASVVRAQ